MRRDPLRHEDPRNFTESAPRRGPRPDTGGVEPPATFPVLLSQAQSGSCEAYAELWRRHAPAVVRFAHARGSADPEDLTSEVFLTVFGRIGDFTGDEGAFRGFMFTVAHRRVVDELRARGRRPRNIEWTSDGDDRCTGSAEHEAIATLGNDRALAMLQALAPDQRDVLVLRIFGDLTIEQTATVLGKRTGAVKALQRRGLEALRRQLQTPAHFAKTPLEGGA